MAFAFRTALYLATDWRRAQRSSRNLAFPFDYSVEEWISIKYEVWTDEIHLSWIP
jgi:hypothetical protein